MYPKKRKTKLLITERQLRTIIREETSWYNIALDIVGLIPGLGEPADIINALDYARKRDYLFAALSLISVIPTVGDAVGKGGKVAVYLAKFGKHGVKAAKGLQATAKSKKFIETAKWIRKVKQMIRLHDKKIKQLFEVIDNNIDHLELKQHLPKIKEALNQFTEDQEDELAQALVAPSHSEGEG